MKLSYPVLVAAIGMCSATALGQNLAGKQETRDYSYGVGRIAWTFPEGLAADFAVPRWTAGARVLCEGRELRCEVQVHVRDISVADEQLRDDLVQSMRLRLPEPLKRVLAFQTYGSSQNIVYVTLEDVRRGEHLRYLTLGYAYKGPALFRFEIGSNNSADIGHVLALVDRARAVDALEKWSLRTRDFRAACDDRFPAYRDANDRAFAASPFAAVDPVRETLNWEPSLAGTVRRRLMEFAGALDGNPPERRRSFCESFPKWVADAAKTL